MNINVITLITCRREPVELVKTYEYLGIMFINSGKIELEITNRVKRVTKMYYALNNKTIFGINRNRREYNTITVSTFSNLRIIVMGDTNKT